MKYDKIRAESAAECMMKLRGQYGSSAIILQTREVKEGGILGLMAKTMYEVHFMVEESPDTKKERGRYKYNHDKSSSDSSKEQNLPAGILSEKKDRNEIDETFTRLQKKKDRLTAMISEKSNLLDKTENDSRENVLRKKEFLVTPNARQSNSSGVLSSSNTEPGRLNSTVDAVPVTEDDNSGNDFQGDDLSLTGEEIVALMKWKTDDETLPSDPEISKDRRETRLPGEARGYKDESQSLDRSERNIYKIRKMLLGAQLSREFTDAFIRDLDHDLSRKEKSEFKLIENKALARLAEVIHTVPDIAPRRGECKAVMLVGPTGSGKTTSIAKLAAKYHLMEKREVSLYSLDHYRLAATEQLKIYADVMSVPFFAPVTPGEFQEFLKRDGAEIMLIDTSGIGISDKNRLLELKKFVDACNVKLEKHLVIAANTSSSSLEGIIQAYDESIGFDKILLTKVDETDFFGSFVEFADKFNRPFSFLTNGQEVPGDLLAPEPEELARMVLGEAVLHAVK